MDSITSCVIGTYARCAASALLFVEHAVGKRDDLLFLHAVFAQLAQRDERADERIQRLAYVGICVKLAPRARWR